jgi:tetratricopeptide (TPR) repeat protein
MDVVKARMAGAQTSPTTVADLESSYLRVFQTPSDGEARVDLAAKQTNLKVASSAIYQLDRAEKLTPVNDKAQLARIAAIQSVTYQESGDSKKAAEQAAKAQKIDPNVLKAGNLAKYKIDPSRIPTARPSAYNPKNNATLATNQTTNTATSSAAAASTVAAAPTLAAPPDSKALMNMISRKQYAEAASGFEKRLQLVGQNARDAYGAALAYSNMGKKPEAARYATMAIDANRKKQELTDAELKTCRDIQSAQ